MTTALVTGGSGFVAKHVILRLLAAGHRVRTTGAQGKHRSREETVVATAETPPRLGLANSTGR